MGVAPRFRVALVGCGRIAHVHAGYLRQVPEVELVGACDLSAESREKFTARWQLPTFADTEELLAAAAPQMVHLLTPPATHARLAIELMEAGVDVLVEKPMALSVQDADAMLVTAQRTGRTLTVDHNRWFDPVMERARHLLATGKLGELVAVDVFAGAAAGEEDLPSADHWKASLPGGLLFDLAPHPAYLMRGLVGAVREVRVVRRLDTGGQIHELRAVVDGERALGTLTISSATRPFANTVTLYGTQMTAFVNLNNMTLTLRRTRRVPKLIGKVLPNLDEAAQLVMATARNTVDFVTGRQRFYPGMGAHFRALYRALAAAQPPPVSAADGRDSVQLLQDLWEGAGVIMADRLQAVAS
jgi:predicted dehydrogenase